MYPDSCHLISDEDLSPVNGDTENEVVCKVILISIQNVFLLEATIIRHSTGKYVFEGRDSLKVQHQKLNPNSH